MTPVLAHRPPASPAQALLGWAPFLAVLALLACFAIYAPHFLDAANLSSILRQSAPLVILACGLSVVVIGGGDDVVSGGIDLSIPAGAVLAAAIASYCLGVTGGGFWTGLALALPAALAVGVANVLLVVGVGLTPLLATLATSGAAIGLSRLITSNRRITVADPAVDWLRDGTLAGVPVPALLALGVLALLAFLTHRTPWGMRLQAVGASRPAAEAAGFPIQRMLAQTYLIAAAAGAVAAVAVLARGTGFSPGSEEPLLLEMVLATFLGAVFSRRRVVTVWGAALGALLVAALSSGFALLQVNIFWTGGVKGALILLVLVASALEERQRR